MTSSRSTLTEKHSAPVLRIPYLALCACWSCAQDILGLVLLECLTMRQKRSGMANRQQRCAGLELVMRAVVAIAVLVDVAGNECIESTTKACPSENSDRDVAFWSRPLADVSTCFTETADCRVANGLPRWHSAAPLVILTARSSNAAAVTAAVTFLRSSLSRTGCTAGHMCQSPRNVLTISHFLLSTCCSPTRPLLFGMSGSEWAAVVPYCRATWSLFKRTKKQW